MKIEEMINQGGSAFPSPELCNMHGDVIMNPQSGMTLRDYFAGQALVGLMPENGWTLGHTDTLGEIRRLATNAHKMADAMLAERNRRNAE